MTDAGGLLPDHDASDGGERARLLHQIATALDLPVSNFLRGFAPEAAEGPSHAECAAALAAFSRIRDPVLRERCLRMLESCADQ